MDFWCVALLFAFMFGIMGWGVSLAFNAYWWFLEWMEGNPINWGFETAFTVWGPFTYLFVIIEITLIYCQ